METQSIESDKFRHGVPESSLFCEERFWEIVPQGRGTSEGVHLGMGGVFSWEELSSFSPISGRSLSQAHTHSMSPALQVDPQAQSLDPKP